MSGVPGTRYQQVEVILLEETIQYRIKITNYLSAAKLRQLAGSNQYSISYHIVCVIYGTCVGNSIIYLMLALCRNCRALYRKYSRTLGKFIPVVQTTVWSFHV